MTAPSYGRMSNDEIFKLTGRTPGSSPYPSINNACMNRKDLLNWGRDFIILQRAFEKKGLPTDPEKIRTWMKAQDGNDLYTIIRTIARDLYQFSPKRNEKFIVNIRGYCSNNTIPLPKYHRSTPQTKGLKVPSKDQTRTMLGFMQDKRHKLIAYLQAESGLAIGTVRGLKNKHIKEIKTSKRPVFIELDPEKYTGKHPEGLAFLSSTAENLYKQLCQEGKIDENDPEAYIISKPKTREPLAYTTIRGVFKRATQDAQLDPKIQPTHCLVKYFNNALEKAGLSDQRQKVHNGHGNGVQDHYTDRDIELARKEYAEAYPFIDIDDPTDPSLVKSIGTQNQEIQQLKEQMKEQAKALNAFKLVIEGSTGKKMTDVQAFTSKTLEKPNQAITLVQALAEKQYWKLAEEEAHKRGERTEFHVTKEEQENLRANTIEEYFNALPPEKRKKVLTKLSGATQKK
jgi:hypothetical protein